MLTAIDTPYNDHFFDSQVDGSLRSARVVAPIVQEIVRAGSVVDFGCGRGSWLRAFRENGAETVLGLDGDYVDTSKLLIDEGEFRKTDLRRPVALDRTFDLAVCLEVAEHLPLGSSRSLVRSLVSAAPIVLFSAAIPGQEGTSHINEQWPEFWERLFADSGHRRLDLIRPRILCEPDVEWWYRQNVFLFASADASEQISARGFRTSPTTERDLEVIERDTLGTYKSFRGLLSATIAAGKRAIRTRLSGSLRGR